MYQLDKLAHSGNLIPNTIIEVTSISVTHSIYAIANFRHSDSAGMYDTLEDWESLKGNITKCNADIPIEIKGIAGYPV